MFSLKFSYKVLFLVVINYKFHLQALDKKLESLGS